jgi:PAS domain S-box-containing protein
MKANRITQTPSKPPSKRLAAVGPPPGKISKRAVAPGTAKGRKKSGTEAAADDPVDLFTSLFETVSGILFVLRVEPRGCFRYSAVNRTLLKVTGLKKGEMVGKTVQEVIPAPSCDRVIKKCREAVRTGQTVKWEEVSVFPTGERYGEVALTPSFDLKGKATHLFGIVHDITASKQAEAALRKSESRFRISLDHSPITIWHEDLDFKFTWMWYPHLDFDPQGLIGKSAADLFPPEEVAQLEEIKSRVLRTGKPSRQELRLTMDGKVLYYDHSIEPLRDARGKIEGLGGVAIDITVRKNAELALRESEGRYARAVCASGEGLWEWNIGQNQTYLSPRYKALLGFADDELPGDRELGFYARLHPDDFTIVEAARKMNLAKFIPYSIEVRLRMKSGEYRWFCARGQAQGDEKGKPVLMTGTISDVTERKITEHALRQSEERFRAVFEQAAVGVGTIDIDTDRFLEVNEPFCNITGRTREEMLSGSFVEMTHPDDLGANMSLHQKLKSGEISRYNLEKRYIRPDGTTVWGNVHATRIASNNGVPVRLLVVVENITERRYAEENYLRELSFNETLVNQTSAIIVLFDHESRMIYLNNATLKMLGYRREELINRTPWDAGIMSAEEATRTRARLGRLMKGEANPPREVVLRGKGGTLHYVEFSSIATLTPDGTADRIIATGTDLTERHHLQREILKISEQEQTRIGHNLHDGVGQTMTGVASMMEAFEGELSGELQARAGRIRQFIQDAIQEVRQMSHSLSPTAVKNRGLVGALQLLADTIHTNHRTACLLEVDTTLHLNDPDRETHVYRIAQEAANNALRHGKAKRITLSLQKLGEHQCELKIQDDGTGIGRKPEGEGHGIGTRVMEYRAHCIGGTLAVTSIRRRGVTVTCRFPRVSVP